MYTVTQSSGLWQKGLKHDNHPLKIECLIEGC